MMRVQDFLCIFVVDNKTKTLNFDITMRKTILLLSVVLGLLAVLPAAARQPSKHMPSEKKMGAYLFTFFNDPIFFDNSGLPPLLFLLSTLYYGHLPTEICKSDSHEV